MELYLAINRFLRPFQLLGITLIYLLYRLLTVLGFRPLQLGQAFFLTYIQGRVIFSPKIRRELKEKNIDIDSLTEGCCFGLTSLYFMYYNRNLQEARRKDYLQEQSIEQANSNLDQFLQLFSTADDDNFISIVGMLYDLQDFQHNLSNRELMQNFDKSYSRFFDYNWRAALIDANTIIASAKETSWNQHDLGKTIQVKISDEDFIKTSDLIKQQNNEKLADLIHEKRQEAMSLFLKGVHTKHQLKSELSIESKVMLTSTVETIINQINQIPDGACVSIELFYASGGHSVGFIKGGDRIMYLDPNEGLEDLTIETCSKNLFALLEETGEPGVIIYRILQSESTMVENQAPLTEFALTSEFMEQSVSPNLNTIIYVCMRDHLLDVYKQIKLAYDNAEDERQKQSPENHLRMNSQFQKLLSSAIIAALREDVLKLTSRSGFRASQAIQTFHIQNIDDLMWLMSHDKMLFSKELCSSLGTWVKGPPVAPVVRFLYVFNFIGTNVANMEEGREEASIYEVYQGFVQKLLQSFIMKDEKAQNAFLDLLVDNIKSIIEMERPEDLGDIFHNLQTELSRIKNNETISKLDLQAPKVVFNGSNKTELASKNDEVKNIKK